MVLWLSRLALNSQRSTHLFLSIAGIKDVLYLASIKSHLKHTHLKVLIQSLVLLPGRYSGRHEEDGHRALDAELRDVGDFDENLSPRG